MKPFRVAAFCSAVFVIAGSAKSVRATEVWFGGGLCWREIDNPAVKSQWAFVAELADGFYINNFSTRYKTQADLDLLQRRLHTTAGLFKAPHVFYETDLIHDNDEHDRTVMALFDRAGFDVKRTTINYGNSPARTDIITRGGTIPLYYMFGPWTIKGDIAAAKNAQLREQILATSGAAVDGPVVMWRKDAGGMHNACYTAINFCHARHKQFLYLLAPNDSGKDFLNESKKVIHGMEDNHAHPDFYAVSFYGPHVFRDTLDVLPEADAAGQPMATFSGVAYYLLQHLKDPQHYAALSVPRANANVVCSELTNRSGSIDFAPVLGLQLPAGVSVTATLGGRPVSQQQLVEGLELVGERRLNAGDHVTLVLTYGSAESIGGTLTLRPSYGEAVSQQLAVTAGSGALAVR